MTFPSPSWRRRSRCCPAHLHAQQAVEGRDGWLIFQPELRSVKPDPTSPVVLRGDSHTLVYPGLPKQLAATFGFPVDLIGTRGAHQSLPAEHEEPGESGG